MTGGPKGGSVRHALDSQARLPTPHLPWAAGKRPEHVIFCFCNKAPPLNGLERHKVTVPQVWRPEAGGGSDGLQSGCWQSCSPSGPSAGESQNLRFPAGKLGKSISENARRPPAWPAQWPCPRPPTSASIVTSASPTSRCLPHADGDPRDDTGPTGDSRMTTASQAP